MHILKMRQYKIALDKAIRFLKEDAYEKGYDHYAAFRELIVILDNYNEDLDAVVKDSTHLLDSMVQFTRSNPLLVGEITVGTCLPNTSEEVTQVIIKMEEAYRNGLDMIINLTIHNRVELVKFLESLKWTALKRNHLDEVYFLIEMDGRQEPVCFWKDEEQDKLYESHCSVRKHMMKEDELPDYVRDIYRKDYVMDALPLFRSMYRDGFLYEIVPESNEAFLNREFKIVKILSEPECLDWFLRSKRNK